MNLRANKYLLVVIIFFGVLYSLISLVNHYNFRTYALDLGAYTNALYDYIHFQWNDSTVFKEVKENLLSDHFDLYLILFSPLSLVFKSYTLLIVQIFFILFGGFGIYKYFTLSGKTNTIALGAAVYLYLFFGVFSAVSFDYHSNVIATSMIPWFFYLLKRRKAVATSFLLLFILISKENISLWMAFICLGLIIEYRKDQWWRYYLLFSSFICVFYFVMVTSIVMPELSNNKTYPHFHYSFLGDNMFDSFLFLLEHPLTALQTLFINHMHQPAGDYIKAEFHILILISGLPLLFFKPQYLFMLIPVYFQKFYNDNYSMWGIDAQYSIEFAPVMAIGIFSVITELRNKRLMKLAYCIVLVSALCCTIRIMDHTMPYTNKSSIRIYKCAHYSRDYSVKKVYEMLKIIPDNAVVSAQSPFLPHLALRDNIYQFPIIKDAEFIIYSRREDAYPMDQFAFDSLTTTLEQSNQWVVEYKNENLIMLRRSSVIRN